MKKEDYEALKSQGIKFQRNLFSLKGQYGERVQKRCRQLLKWQGKNVNHLSYFPQLARSNASGNGGIGHKCQNLVGDVARQRVPTLDSRQLRRSNANMLNTRTDIDKHGLDMCGRVVG